MPSTEMCKDPVKYKIDTIPITKYANIMMIIIAIYNISQQRDDSIQMF